MRLDEVVDVVEVVDARRVFDVGRVRVLVALAEAHQRLVRPRVAVEDRDLDDARLERRSRARRRPRPRSRAAAPRMSSGLDPVRVEPDLERGVGRADLDHAVGRPLAQRRHDGHRAEEGLAATSPRRPRRRGARRRPSCSGRSSRRLLMLLRSRSSRATLQPAGVELARAEPVRRRAARRAAASWSSRRRPRARASARRSARQRGRRGPRPRRSACRAANRRRAGPRSPARASCRSAPPARPAARTRSTGPGLGRKPFAGSSALMRTSIAWPRGAMSVLREPQRLAAGDAEHLGDEVDAGDRSRSPGARPGCGCSSR